MIIIGHPWINSPQFCKVFLKENIKHTQANQIVLLEPLNESHTIAQYCQENSIAFAVATNTLTDALFANALGAKYIICEEDDASIIQPIATEYLFDARLLVLIHSENEISKIARIGIDGVILPEAIC
jgi:phosphorylcholine metabolism protein LicD